jgi:hypothetical protein
MLRVTILGTLLGGESIDGARVEDVVAKQAELAIGSALVPASEMDGLRDGLRACRSDAGCLSARIEAAGVDRLIDVVVNLEVVPALLTLRIIDAGQRHAVASRIVDVEGELDAELHRTVVDLLERAGETIGGMIAVDVEPSDAVISVLPAARPHSRASGVFIAAPGRYAVNATRDGFDDASGAVEVARARSTPIRLTLEERPSLAANPWLWVGVGVAAAATVTAAIVIPLVVLRRGEEDDICIPMTAPECVR